MVNFKINSIVKYLVLINILFLSNSVEAEKFKLANPYKTYGSYGDCVEEGYYGGTRATRCIRYKGKRLNTLKSSLFLSCKLSYKTRDNRDSYDYRFLAVSQRDAVVSVLSAKWYVNDYKAKINKWKGLISWNGAKFENDTKFVIQKLKNPFGENSYSYEEIRNENKPLIIGDTEIGDSKFSGKKWKKAYKRYRSGPSKGTCKKISKLEHVKYRNYYPILIK